ncbi:TPA: hypothetical protein DDZ10_03090 [Candidatus Uhrbacteria bacterium]|nr:MAG: hypothetical protein A3D69_00780 [Candidatus Uhrbacteria bacterium RIFCSPHIGHO2_02_FULL_54_11]HBL39634.1 hypothetical protein [Candidatus Uhrbacteria bacterium]
MIELATGEVYHIYTRGVDKRQMFDHDLHYKRFWESLYLFNDKNYSLPSSDVVYRGSELQTSIAFGDVRERLVDVIAANPVGNHLHLCVKQLVDRGISILAHRLFKGHARYYNVDTGREGKLFDGPFKAKHVDSQAYLEYLPIYTHLNSLDRYGIPWREGLMDAEMRERAWKILENDPWSSHHVYMGRSQELQVIHPNILQDTYPTPDIYKSEVMRRMASELPFSESL